MATPSSRQSLVKVALSGARAGVAATGAMSTLMGLGEKIGLMRTQPPKQIVETAWRKADHDRPPDKAVNAMATVAHLAYGAGSGAAYSLLRRFLPVGPPALQGAAFGLAIWVVSYMGWVPAFGALPPAHRDQPGRVSTMIAAHALFGAALGATLEPAE